MATPAWQNEGVAVGGGDMVTDSLAHRTIANKTAIDGVQADVTAIKTETDKIDGVQTDVTAIKSETDKIDGAAADGLLGTGNSLGYLAGEIERHLHSYERWFGAAVTPDGEAHVADRIGTTTTAFQADAGNNTWGGWLQVLGSDDTPADAGRATYDPHRIMVVALQNANAIHFVQLALGSSGGAALTAGSYSELVFKPLSVQGQETILMIQTRNIVVGTKAWVRAWVVGQNTSTMDFFLGIHEYEG